MERKTTLPSEEVIIARLSEVKLIGYQPPPSLEHFYLLIAQEAGKTVTAPQLVLMLYKKAYQFAIGLSPKDQLDEETLERYKLILSYLTIFINVLSDDAKLAKDASLFTVL